ncbi:ribonuclease T [Actibacterium mucosum KCTC 23349]|uniref:Ribonuclease T n=1 Tax=Actibacterium mucosum KCTC 23349 TaxID=1454373 RepID=A0A037ZFM6_9RHOB|nr:ribonuclease T2 [Actibacterium mucosum]KAJ54913.1 ribonuclease T [Actibacterium mucosum KCTC 23349]
MRWLLILLLSATIARAEGERAGDFDYYVLALSWSPTWCAIEGRERGSPQCDADHGWVLHGLWPQYEDGWPSYCRTMHRPATRSETGAMVDIMGSSGSAWHQWKKHGVCSGLSAPDFFALSRLAYDQVNRPDVFRKLSKPVKLPARVVEEAFLQANPDWAADMLTITCRDARIQEARLCLTRDMKPRVCGADVRRDCTMQDALFDPIN